jgi:hypothetical protein
MTVALVDPGEDSGVVVGPEVDVSGEEGVTLGVVVGSLERTIMELSDAMMLERRLPKPVLLLVVEAAAGVGVTSEVVTPVAAAPLTPAVGVGVGERRFVRVPISEERGSDVAAIDAEAVVDAAADAAAVVNSVGLSVGLAAGVVVAAAAEVGVGVGVGDSSTLVSRLSRIGTSSEADAVDVVEEAAAVDVAAGSVELDVEPDKTPPGPKVIPLPAAEDEVDGVSTVVAAALAEEEAAVGRTRTDGIPPVEAAPPVTGSNRLSTEP